MDNAGNTLHTSERLKNSLQNRALWIRRFALMLADMLVVTAAGAFVLWARFEFHWESIDEPFAEVYFEHLLLLLPVMLIIFWLFRLYSSLWEFAGFSGGPECLSGLCGADGS